MTPPPLLAGWLLRALLPRDPCEAIAGDLDEAWYAGGMSRACYWRLAVASIAAFHRPQLVRPPRPPVFPHVSNPKGDGFMRSLLHDLGYGLRLLRRAPAFTAAAVATLALGIGANTAIFSVLNLVLLKPLPHHDAGRVAFVPGWDTERQATRFSISLAGVVELKHRARALESIAVYSYWSANLTGGDRPERVQAYTVSDNTFELLGVPARLGRTLVSGDGAPGAPDVAVISHGLWQRRFGGDPSVAGRQVQVDGRTWTIVGVMPEAFEFPVFNFKGDLWAPRPVDEAALLANRAARHGHRPPARRHSVSAGPGRHRHPDASTRTRPPGHQPRRRRAPHRDGRARRRGGRPRDAHHRGDRRNRAAARLRQRGESPARARCGPPSRAGGALGARRRARPHRPPASRRKPAARRYDPLTFTGVAVVLGCVGFAACAVPAWRATRVEPVTALRMD